MLLESLEDKETLKAKELDKALDKLNKRYTDVAKVVGVTAAAVYQWIHTSNNIPKKHRNKVIKALIKWKEEQEDMKEEKPVSPREASKTPEEKAKEKAEKKKEEIKDKERDKSEVRKARDELGVTQRFVSSAIGMHTGTYGNKENVKDENNSFNAEERKRISIVFNKLRNIKNGGLFEEEVDTEEDGDILVDILETLDLLAKNIESIPNKIIRRHTLGLLNAIRRELKEIINKEV